MIPEKYFYTVLFLDDYYPKKPGQPSDKSTVEIPVLKNFEITKTTNTENIKWLDSNTLFVRHNLQMPLTLEMWNDEGKPIFYCPLLKEGIDSISVGQVVIESSRSLTLHFNDEVKPPEDGETFKLAIKTLPSFDTTDLRLAKDTENVSAALDEMIDHQKYGLAIVFRRNSLDSYFDLICEFDEAYFHSLAESSDLKYLTSQSKFQRVKWLSKYTDNVQNILDDINTAYYDIKFSWKENGTQWWSH